MKHIVTGIIAHVDAGKTTLSEALLYKAGALSQLGRVDNGDAFLDPDDLEKKRGITIFSHEANLQYQQLNLTLLDTPGHADFGAQTEQVLSVLDYAILVVSATDGVQGYTRTLWRLLDRYHIPTFIFVNKMDAPGVEQEELLTQLQTELSPGCLAFGGDNIADNYEDIALQDDAVLDSYVESDTLSDDVIRQLISQRKVFPTYFGAALKLTGVETLMSGLQRWTNERPRDDKFGARIFKVSHDEKGERLTWVRVTGGALHPRDEVLPDQKINQLRLYNGVKYSVSQSVTAGEVCAITGLTGTRPGQGLGNLAESEPPVLQPVLTYKVDPKGNDLHACLEALRQLGDEDPQLHVTWSSQLQEIRVQLMGMMQLEVIQQLLQHQFNLDVSFDEGSILYKETITDSVEGVGHFEPLRHYAEVHLLMEPAELGSGVTFATNCSLEVLDKNWQHQIMTNLAAKQHLGVLIGAPITDINITLIGGRGSIVHTVGGDFRQATWRAVRQGLMMTKQQGKAQLLEPWYQFRLTVTSDQVGRAMNDIQRMSGEFESPDDTGGNVVTLTGTAPVAEMQGYAQTVNAYTHGQGELECVFDGYQPCYNADDVISAAGYDPVADLENTPDSVFCAHGAGYPVKWDQLPVMAHYPYAKK
ncbi:TetM/TetW/TetO/TetS family tetracycline resistance ribosomal protection protein [Lactobacillus sp. LC28-10]|uniref:TetM/TetW/TetO/TetS family tetracycline resistance ribosomal protection protein n=1 Tax=Secundilactobacillus angelensis TaxID=2722706 RepID=A0ABX1KTR4_9LACO|nr:TetM/TetW/TetO/TetS family tetracycline resistance ribosomal protection protein [Secundilactobacillus angelensis]MCH5461824.1 TetM/TetW/TetO/TetS family tetracycline resistance ribosomal protection protein [Secundilactobacillus angelensis]NLR17312.1 TetM/TetW/TetO/TetS family tetracycline resistance ribosomal protection protein [Secundilactobacillus angelensis]